MVPGNGKSNGTMILHFTSGGQQAVAVSDEGGLLTEGRQLSAQILFNSDTSDQYE